MNRQIEVMLLLVSPLLVLFSLFLPILLPLLYTGKFMPALGMMQVIMLAMYFRAIKLPVQYIPLAKGDSTSYLLLEAIYDVILVIAVILNFNRLGLVGAGWAITIAGFLDAVLVFVYSRWKYGYKVSSSVLLYSSIQIPIGLLTFMITQQDNLLVYWGGGLLLAMISIAISFLFLRKKANLWKGVASKLLRRIKRDGNN